MGPRYTESVENTKVFYIDANNLYGWATSQYCRTAGFEKVSLDTSYYTKNYNQEQLIEVS